MKRRITCISLVLLLLLSGAVTALAETDYIDYSEWDSRLDYRQWDRSTPYPEDVMNTKLQIPVTYLVDWGIVTGDADGLFHPKRNINRAEFATMVAKATNSLVEIESFKEMEIFNDLSGYGWAKGAINAVATANIFKGKGGNTFAPGEKITYAEIITAIIRMRGAGQAAESTGNVWPDNYIYYAEMHTINGNVVIRDWNAQATREDVAWLLYTNLPNRTESRAALRSLTVNSINAIGNGNTYTAGIGKTATSAAIEAVADNHRDEIIIRYKNGAVLGSGLGRAAAMINNIALPCEVEINVKSGGSFVTTFTLRIT